MSRPEPSRDELLTLLERACEALEASQYHWADVMHLTGDRRYQRQHQEALKLIEAMRRRVGEEWRRRGGSD